MKIKLWGVKGVRINVYDPPSSIREKYGDRIKKLKLDVPKEENVFRIMTGRNVGHWVNEVHFHGDCLTNMYIDAIGAIQPMCLPLNMTKVEMFEIEIDIDALTLISLKEQQENQK
jgi:hypothetical protein